MRLNGIAVTAFIKSEPVLTEFFVMTASSCDQAISTRSPNDSSPRRLFDAAPSRDCLMVKACVTYAPLAVWKDSHWVCSVTTLAPSMRQRLKQGR
jgi:hypothetical protein